MTWYCDYCQLAKPARFLQTVWVETAQNLVPGVRHDRREAAERTRDEVLDVRLTQLVLLHLTKYQ